MTKKDILTEKKNMLVRNAVAESGLYYWQLADFLGISSETLHRRLRHELPQEEQKRMIQIIKENSQ